MSSAAVRWAGSMLLATVLGIGLFHVIDDARDSICLSLNTGNRIQQDRLELEIEESKIYRARIASWLPPLEITEVDGKDAIKGMRVKQADKTLIKKGAEG
ncbi:MAG: hypothetical protein GY799_21030 [Desulfobulbaceae bacterium]|nr:hypothetical protein [Desulfobulbaceae bacterium]